MAMTDEDFARACAEYDALPGTAPDGYSFRSNEEIGDREPADVGRELVESWRADGDYQHARVTKTDDGLWLEVWKERPRKEAPFNPPYTLTQTGGAV